MIRGVACLAYEGLRDGSGGKRDDEDCQDQLRDSDPEDPGEWVVLGVP